MKVFLSIPYKNHYLDKDNKNEKVMTFQQFRTVYQQSNVTHWRGFILITLFTFPRKNYRLRQNTHISRVSHTVMPTCRNLSYQNYHSYYFDAEFHHAVFCPS